MRHAERMKESVGEETLLAVMNWLKASEQTGADKDDLETKALDALENLEQAKKEQGSRGQPKPPRKSPPEL